MPDSLLYQVGIFSSPRKFAKKEAKKESKTEDGRIKEDDAEATEVKKTR